MLKVTPFLLFSADADEVAHFYVDIFDEAKIVESRTYDAAGVKCGSVTFEIAGQRFIAFNGGPPKPFSLATSFFVECDTQDQIDRYWTGLAEGGKPIQCGWIEDRYGMTWQIAPKRLGEMLQDADHTRAKRVMQQMMTMVKLDIAPLEAAYRGD